MDPENPNAFKRSSMHQALYSRPVERRASKKSSSRDRHGMVYPDSFRDTSIRTVTPESHSPANHSPLSEPEHLTGASSSPRNTVRPRPNEPERRRDFNKHSSGAGEEDPPAEARVNGRDRGQRQLRSNATTSPLAPSKLERGSGQLTQPVRLNQNCLKIPRHPSVFRRLRPRNTAARPSLAID